MMNLVRVTSNFLKKARQDESQAAKVANADEAQKFFITVSRRGGHRRLHLVGCFVKPSNCCEVRLCNTVTAEDFDSICRACRKRMLQETGKDTPEESSSTASSSSTNAVRSEVEWIQTATRSCGTQVRKIKGFDC